MAIVLYWTQIENWEVQTCQKKQRNRKRWKISWREINASFSNFRDDDMLIWDKLVQMQEDKTEFEVTVEGIVKGGVIAYVEGIRAFIPVSKLALHYVENPEDYLKKTLMVRVFEADEQENRLILSAKEILKEKADAEKLDKINDIKVGSIVEGKVDSLQTYGAFIDLGDGLSGLVHISQISDKRIKSPKAVLNIGDTVTAKSHSKTKTAKSA